MLLKLLDAADPSGESECTCGITCGICMLAGEGREAQHQRAVEQRRLSQCANSPMKRYQLCEKNWEGMTPSAKDGAPLLCTASRK